MKTVMMLAALAGVAACAEAQVGSGSWIWEVSSNGGASWQGGVTVIPTTQSSVLVRVRAGWSGDAGMYAFASATFDVKVSSTNVNADDATGFSRISGGVNYTQTLVSSRFGNLIKIDDARDTMTPCVGTRGIVAGQFPENIAGQNFTTDNPVTVFGFTLNLDTNDLSDRTISCCFIRRSFGNVSVYTDPNGNVNFLDLSCSGAVVRYVPAPGSLALPGLGVLSLCSRRRPRSGRECAARVLV